MSNVIDFRDAALIQLRDRVAALDEANADLLAYARGHSGAVAQIHAAALAAMDAESLEHLIHVVCEVWADLLGLDAVTLALVAGDMAVTAQAAGIQTVNVEVLSPVFAEPRLVLRGVPQGNVVFGPASSLIRSEALVRLSLPEPLPKGVLALGSRVPHAFETAHGGELLIFLGAVVSRMISRWLTA